MSLRGLFIGTLTNPLESLGAEKSGMTVALRGVMVMMKGDPLLCQECWDYCVIMQSVINVSLQNAVIYLNHLCIKPCYADVLSVWRPEFVWYLLCNASSKTYYANSPIVQVPPEVLREKGGVKKHGCA